MIKLSIELKQYEKSINFLSKFKEVYPGVEEFIDILKDRRDAAGKIKKWIKHDLKKIIEICRRRGAKVILQNYPISTKVNFLLKQIAEEEKVVFVNNYITFERLFRSKKRDKYISSDGAHCNANGYRIIAQKLYNKIIKKNLLEVEN